MNGSIEKNYYVVVGVANRTEPPMPVFTLIINQMVDSPPILVTVHNYIVFEFLFDELRVILSAISIISCVVT